MVKDGTWREGKWKDVVREECRPCDALLGADCSERGSTVPTLKTKVGYWRAGVDTIHFDSIGCGQGEGICNGGKVISTTNTSDEQCVHGHTGLMCLNCDRANGYKRGAPGMCIKCDGQGIEWAKLVEDIAIYGTAFLFVRFRFWKPFKERFTRPEQLRKQIYKRQMKVKILLAFVQIGSHLHTTFRIKLPLDAMKFFRWIQFFDLNFMRLILRYCACEYDGGYYTTVLTSTLAPLVVLGFLFLRKQYDFLLFFSFIVYAPTSQVLIKYFDCYQAWHGGKDTPPTKYLLHDPSIKCTDDTYISMRIYVQCMVGLYVVGLPCGYACLLWFDRKTIRPTAPNARSKEQLVRKQKIMIPSKGELKLALAEYFGYFPTPPELEELYSYWAREGIARGHDQANVAEKGFVPVQTSIKYSHLVELFHYGELHGEWEKRNQNATAGLDEPGNVSQAAPVLENVPPALTGAIGVAAIRAQATVVTKSAKDREIWAMRCRELDQRPQRSGFLWKVPAKCANSHCSFSLFFFEGL
jgi:hypothetical protein